MPDEDYEDDEGHMPNWKRKKNLEQLQQLKVTPVSSFFEIK